MLGDLGRETHKSIKRGSGAQALKVSVAEFASLKVENFLWEWISVINLKCYMLPL